MTSRATSGAAVAFTLVAAALFVGVAVHELNYAAGHPYQYGPAKVIALLAAAVLALAVGLLAVGALRMKGNR